MRRVGICSIAFLVVIQLCETAWGFNTRINESCEPGRVVLSRVNNLRLNDISFPDNTPNETAIISAISEYNSDIPGSYWNFNWVKDYDNTYRFNDGLSDVAIISGENFSAGLPAATVWFYTLAFSSGQNCYYMDEIVEADILFNNDYFSSDLAVSGSSYNLKAYALHQLGYALGLAPENRWVATMGAGRDAHFGLNRNLPMIHSDDKAGMRFLYGDGGTAFDMAVHAFKQTSIEGEYGTIDFVEQSTSVMPGDYAFMEFTLENHGTTTMAQNVGIYIKRNGDIFWTLMGVTNVGMSAGSVATIQRHLLIPSGFPAGTYLVKIIANSGLLPEFNELNNEMILPLPIEVLDNTPPSAPSNLVANVVLNSVNLEWDLSTDDVDGMVTRYRVERCEGEGCSNFMVLEVNQINAQMLSYGRFMDIVYSLPVRYSYRVSAMDAAGNMSGYSNTVSVVVDIMPPTMPLFGLRATAIGSDRIDLTWNAASDDLGVSEYKVERCKGLGCGFYSQIATVTGLSYSDSGLIDFTSYSYRVRAADFAGNLSQYSFPASATTLWGPTSLYVSDVPNDQGGALKLTWQPSIRPGVFQQRIYRMNDAGAYVLIHTIMENATSSYTDTGLTNEKLYNYVVRGFNGISESVNSNVSGAIPKDNIAPVAPTGLVVADVAGDNGGALVLSWIPSTSADAIKQRVLRATKPGGPYNDLGTQITNNTTTTYTDTGLTNGTTYYYAVQAGDTGGWSVNSNTASAIPQDNVAPSAPTGLTVADVPGDNGDALALSWIPSSSADVTQQRIYRAAMAGGSYTLVTTKMNKTGSSHTDTGLTSGTSYFYIVRAYDGIQESANSNEAVTATIDNLLPDLTVGALSGPASALLGSSIAISDTVDNRGIDSAGASIVGFYLSTDASITTSDTFLGSRSVAVLAAGSSGSGNTSVTIPAGLVPGNYYLGAWADYNGQIPESNETNNARAGGATTITITAPDLVVMVISGPTNALTGGTISLSNTVKNQGTASAGSFSVGLYLSTDATITTQDTLLGSRTVASLAVGASNNASTSVTIPVTVPAGTYYLGVIADVGGQVIEGNETNNGKAGNTIAITLGPDLVMTAVSGPSSAVIGGSITLLDTAKNQGTSSTVNPFSVGLYLSSDATITTSDTFLGSRSVTVLAAGSSGSGNTSVTIPAGLVPGTYYLGALADYNGQIPEKNETNNARAGATITITTPDLVVMVISGPTNALTGGTISLSNTVKNQGTASAGSFAVGLYLSTDATITTQDTLLGSRTVASLAVGASNNASTGVTIPAGLAGGVYYLGAVADYTNQVPEGNETNNGRTGNSITINP